MSDHEFSDPPKVDTPLGPGRAILFRSDIHDNYWTVVIDKNLAIVDFRQSQLRWGRSYTAEQGISDKQMREIIKRG